MQTQSPQALLEMYLQKKIPNEEKRSQFMKLFQAGRSSESNLTQLDRNGKKITVERAVEDLRKLFRKNNELKQTVAALQQSNSLYKDRNNKLTRAIGACECLGEDAGCPDCKGTGLPGTRPIGEEEFSKFIYPLLQKLTVAGEDKQ